MLMLRQTSMLGRRLLISSAPAPGTTRRRRRQEGGGGPPLTLTTRRALASSSSSSHWGRDDQQHQQQHHRSKNQHEQDDPFVILEVDVDADEKEIKAQFLALAKKHHPDAKRSHGGSGGRKNDAAAFVRLIKAYELLSDPTSRAQYILKRRPQLHHHSRRPSAATNSATNGSSSNPAVDLFNASMRKGRQRSARRRAMMFDMSEEEGEGMNLNGGSRRGARSRSENDMGLSGLDQDDLSWKDLSLFDGGISAQLQAEFEEAMVHAYLGPPVEGDEIPWAFEGEERRPPHTYVKEEKEGGGGEEEDEVAAALHPHILQLTSGQTLLGYVEASPLCPSSLLQQQQQHNTTNTTTSEEEDQDEEAEQGEEALAFHSQLAGLVSVEGKGNYVPLKLMWQGKHLATSTRLRDPRTEEDVIVVQTQREAEEEEEGSNYNSPDGATTEEGDISSQQQRIFLLRGLDTTRILSTHHVHDLLTGKLTHILVSHRTPLVSHLHFLQLEGGIECRIQKGDVKAFIPSDLWHFPPRSKAHDGAAWYFEQADAKDPIKKHKRQERRCTLPPAVYILACSYKTLDKEEAAYQKRNSRSAKLANTMKSFAKEWVGKFV